MLKRERERERKREKESGILKKYIYIYLGGGFKYFLFSTLFGEGSHFD